MRPVVYPVDWLFRDQPPPLSDFGRRFLAEGDSWFTIGTLNLPAASNILFKLEFSVTTAIVNCAYPGDTLQHMVDSVHDPYFDRLLRRRNFASFWEAIVLSAGGNDLIDAARVSPTQPDGTPTASDLRLLRSLAEVQQAGGPADARDFVSGPGFARLAGYLRENFRELVRRREAGPSAGRPIFVHTYATPTARPAGTIGSPQGWLYPALQAYGVPAEFQQQVTAALFQMLRRLLLDMDHASGTADALPAVHVFDSANLPGIVPAAAGSTGPSGDWVNEIHLSPDGYAKVGQALGAYIDGALAQYP